MNVISNFLRLLPAPPSILTASMVALIVIAAVTGEPCAFANDDEHLFEVGGRVLDAQQNPLTGIQAKLLDRNGNALDADTSGVNGVFLLKHKECDSCTLSVSPKDKSPFASALIEDIPGNIDRKFSVTLQHGFKVSGTVTGGGKGLRGLVVKVTAADSYSGKVHSGGETRTIHGGTFAVNLTPGLKKLVVMNDKYPEYARTYERKLTVTADREIPEIQLPDAKQE
jgi:hypothetical protein